MEEIIVITLFICCFLVVSVYVLSKNKYCNSNYNFYDAYDKLKIDEPEYTVHRIKRVSTKNKGTFIAEYILWNFYFNKKHSVEHQELIIYDEIGKYQIGDKLKFTKACDKTERKEE